MWIDAHNHLQRFAGRLDAETIFAAITEDGVECAVVNGTNEDDWEQVAELARKYSWMIPSFGVHPWSAPARSKLWEEKLREYLEEFPGAGVGEVGLDRWIANHDLEDQSILFRRQLELAAELNRPVTVHCLRAWGALAETLKNSLLPERGFLIHAYGGPVEMVETYLKFGARFSFNGYFLGSRQRKKLETFREVPLDRLLVETDAPDMLIPVELQGCQLTDESGKPLNHPANLPIAARSLAEFLKIDSESLAGKTTENARSLFLL